MAQAPAWEDLDALLAPLGTPDCRPFRNRILRRRSLLATPLALDYLHTARREGYVAANQRLLTLDQRLQREDLNLAWDDDALRKFARRRAADCARLSSRHPAAVAWSCASELPTPYGIAPPDVKGADPTPALNRMADPNWWMRKLRRLQAQAIEAVARDLGMVANGRACYASPYARSRRHRQKIAQRDYLQSATAISDDGEALSLWDAYQGSVSNPAVRRAELMTRIKGFEIVANHLGHVGEFYTLSAPGCMHATIKTGQANPRYLGTDPAQVQQHLNHVWQLVRAELHRQGIRPYGFRVVEPHHDGTPHWHLLLFMPRGDTRKVRDIFTHYALRDHGDEKGAARHRFKAVAIDPERGSAAGYVAKYVAKNIDGAHLERDLHGNDARDSAQAIDAWASTWRIRQFQQIGGPSVTVWRELRRLEPGTFSPLEAARSAADSADWAAYCLVMGGMDLPRRDRPVSPLYEEPLSVDSETGEILPDSFTRYGDLKGARLVGLVASGVEVRTRLRRWTIQLGMPPSRSSLSDSEGREAEGQRPCRARRPPLSDSCQ